MEPVSILSFMMNVRAVRRELSGIPDAPTKKRRERQRELRYAFPSQFKKKGEKILLGF
jgi:hypothetical protein